MRLLTIPLCVAVILGIPWSGAAQRQPNSLRKLMDEKLNNSKMLLEGIALADFNKISRSAENLIQLSKTAEWFVKSNFADAPKQATTP